MQEYIRNLDEYNSILLTKKLFGFQNDDKNYNFLISDNVTCTPLGMLLIADTIKRFRETKSDSRFTIHYNTNSNSINYAGHMGFFKTISEKIDFGKLPGEASGSDRYVPITEVRFKVPDNNIIYSNMLPINYIEFEANRLAKVISQNNKNLEDLFTFLIREMLRNSFEHGKVDSAKVCAQFWKSKDLAEIAILDNGIGYKESLKKKYSWLNTDRDAIIWAIKPGISESNFSPHPQEDDNSGFGLYTASELCSKLGGSFTILSGNTIIKKSSYSIIEQEAYHDGTVLKLEVRTNINFDYRQLLSNIVRAGEKQLNKKGENIKVSELSKGKLLMR